MTKQKRLLAVLLCAVFLLTAVCASAFLATHFEHIHTGDGCSTCAAIYTAGQLLIGLQLLVLLFGIPTTLPAWTAALRRVLHYTLPSKYTLCSLKVRLTE